MLHSPIDQLHSFNPTLATSIQTVANQLHTVGSEPRLAQTISSDSTAQELAAQRHRRLAKEYDDLLSQARALPGFQDFLRPMKAKNLFYATKHGPVVMIICHEDRCDALLVLPEQKNVNHVHLPDFNRQKAQLARQEMEKSLRNKGLRERGVKLKPELGETDNFKRVLATLWYNVIKPVLDYLGYTNNPVTGNLPHVTWCPTGTLSFLPLHAAGDYDQPQSRIFHYVISSYTPTLTALLACTPSILNPNSKILAIGLEHTPGHSPLPGTAGELVCVKGHVQGAVEYSQLVNSQATTSSVLEAMEKHDWVHLACHAHQNVEDPTKSGFLLHGGTLDLAAINRRSFKKKGLAFLSACQTATGDEKLPDEAVHLASGMLMAGYPSVIGTMWSVFDDDAPFVADKVYARLMKDKRVGNGEAGRALHIAVAELRDKIGEGALERWVPYIHIGA